MTGGTVSAGGLIRLSLPRIVGGLEEVEAVVGPLLELLSEQEAWLLRAKPQRDVLRLLCTLTQVEMGAREMVLHSILASLMPLQRVHWAQAQSPSQQMRQQVLCRVCSAVLCSMSLFY